ncbi:MAG: L-seryl-tRNA(Sec) selenium transferase [Planctomycetes bacterium]|nr:L-seryl-tRNA(Sec) selenium transferase [Planctomycetota bacterium]
MSRPASPAASLLRQLPSIDACLSDPEAAGLCSRHGREAFTDACRHVLDALRERIRRKGERADRLAEEVAIGKILAAAASRLSEAERPRLSRVINATGIVLHTGLGRAVLPEAAIEAISREQRGYSLLEVDGVTGERSQREQCVRDLLTRVSGAEAATVVNNNAAATLLALAALARGKEVIVSRGQCVEIGGAFRIPEVMAQSGARLVEIGTTNKTYLSDYESAITPDTGALLHVHTSNFRVVGFTAEVTVEELVALGRRRGLPVIDDLGSGSLLDPAALGVGDEPQVQRSVKAGSDVVCFSGDKLLGGPQAGILVGRKDVIATIRRHPLFRALRVDKLTLTALEATLNLYRDPERARRESPTWRMLTAPPDSIARRARRLARAISKIPGLKAECWPDVSQVGGGSLPGNDLPTTVVACLAARHPAQALADRLRTGRPPVFTRVKKDRVCLDPRTLLPGEDREVLEAMKRAGE